MDQPIAEHQIRNVPLDQLNTSLALRPADPAHVLVLAQVLDDCPPVILSRGTFQVLDGHMRVEAARALGRDTVRARSVDGDDQTLLETAISANTQHGLPLTILERKAAALRLLALAPEWSNRRIARACGLSETTVRRMPRPGASAAQLDTRVGSDGKTYRGNDAALEAARRLLRSDPHRSDRAIARAVGLSPTTVGRLRRSPAPREPPRGRPGMLRRLLGALAALRRLLRHRLKRPDRQPGPGTR